MKLAVPVAQRTFPHRIVFASAPSELRMPQPVITALANRRPSVAAALDEFRLPAVKAFFMIGTIAAQQSLIALRAERLAVFVLRAQWPDTAAFRTLNVPGRISIVKSVPARLAAERAGRQVNLHFLALAADGADLFHAIALYIKDGDPVPRRLSWAVLPF